MKVSKISKQIGLFLLILIIVFVITTFIGKIEAWPCTSSCNSEIKKCQIGGLIDIKCDIQYKGIPNNLQEEHVLFYFFGLPILISIGVFYFLNRRWGAKIY